MRFIAGKLRQYSNSQSGAVSISASWILGIFIIVIGGGVELAHAYWQSNALQHAARIGVRVATTSDSVALGLSDITGLESAEAGDPMPDYKIICFGKTQSCSKGGFDQVAFKKVLFGRDLDGQCKSTNQERRGMCDYFDRIKADQITIIYENSGMGRAGNPADLMPLVTVKIEGIQRDFVFLDMFSSNISQILLSSQASAVAEDLRSGGL